MKLTFRTMERRSYTIEAPLELTTTQDLLLLIEKEHGFNKDNISLIFSGKVLSESTLLSSLNYKEGDWFVLFLRKLSPRTTAVYQPPAPTTASVTANKTALEADVEAEIEAEAEAEIEAEAEADVDVEQEQEQDATPAVVTASAAINTTKATETGRVSVKLPNKEIKALQQIKGSLLRLIKDLQQLLNDYQINTLVYEAYQAAEKDADLALNMLLFRILGPLTDEQLNILKEISKYDE